jgi:hypothetical protein
MCDRLSYSHGYLCDECFEELVQLGPTADIDAFMQSHRYTKLPNDVARSLFDEVFVKRED